MRNYTVINVRRESQRPALLWVNNEFLIVSRRHNSLHTSTTGVEIYTGKKSSVDDFSSQLLINSTWLRWWAGRSEKRERKISPLIP